MIEKAARCETLGKIWFRRRAHRVEPATDVNLGMGFAAVMPGSRRVGGLRIPPVHGQIGISTSNDEPVDGIGGNESTDFTSEFLQRCHALSSVDLVVSYAHFVIEAGR